MIWSLLNFSLAVFNLGIYMKTGSPFSLWTSGFNAGTALAMFILGRRL